MIRVENLTKTYKIEDIEVNAMKGISLNIKEGEFIAIIGSSGSGKSTLMNVLGCLDVPTSGKYWLDGEDVSNMTDNKLAEVRNTKIGFVFQSFNLLPRLTALENVERPLIYRDMGRKERIEKAKIALEKVGLGDRMGHRPTQLSGGQQQRVAVARALVGEPPVILADEPTGNLDSKSSKDVMELLKALHNQGKTLILITHDPDIAEQAHRQVHIHDGQIIGEKGRSLK